jgi:pimeloyl-ACP methyl ester carboxylesterase
MHHQLFRLGIAAGLIVLGAASLSAQTAPTVGDYSGAIDIGGRRIHLECRGSGSPTVILLSGYRNDADIWSVEVDGAGQAARRAAGATGNTKKMVLPGVAGITRVCAYDRPGTILDQDHFSRSDPVAMPRTAEAVVDELHALITAAGIAPPNVLVAHSLGGLFARLYASTYPGTVAGIVLVDAWQEDLPELLAADQWKAYVELATPPPPGLAGYTELEVIDFAAASAAMQRAAMAHPLRDLPLVIISRAKPVALPPDIPAAFSPDAFEAAWRAGQDRLARLAPDARRIIAVNSDHYVQLSEPELVIAAVRRVVEAVRDPGSWTR